MKWMIPDSLERQLLTTLDGDFDSYTTLQCYDSDAPNPEEDLVGTGHLRFYAVEEYPDGSRTFIMLRYASWQEAPCIAIYTARELQKDIDRDNNATRLGKDILRAAKEAR